MKRVLNVGGASKSIPIPGHYAGWDHVLLDVDAAQRPDVVCDARTLTQLPAELYDAVYCSHNLEHYWRHDLPRVLAGFAHVLRAHGFAEVAVPDLKAVFADMLRRGLDIDDVLYQSDAGPVTVNDVIYGHGGRDRLIGAGGNDQLFGGPGSADDVSGGLGVDQAANDPLDAYAGVEQLLA